MGKVVTEVHTLGDGIEVLLTGTDGDEPVMMSLRIGASVTCEVVRT